MDRESRIHRLPEGQIFAAFLSSEDKKTLHRGEKVILLEDTLSYEQINQVVNPLLDREPGITERRLRDLLAKGDRQAFDGRCSIRVHLTAVHGHEILRNPQTGLATFQRDRLLRATPIYHIDSDIGTSVCIHSSVFERFVNRLNSRHDPSARLD